MTAQLWDPWDEAEWTCPELPTRPRLRLVRPDETFEDSLDVPVFDRPPVTRRTAVARPAAAGQGWQLTQRGMALALAGLGALLAGGLGTLIIGFLSVSNAPLP
ncbi:MAG: hypothetical protein LBR33_09920 [Propionibacteriaceae bacterium]|nr:hypothetical protein [Propionibacteriaceae bacterium]